MFWRLVATIALLTTATIGCASPVFADTAKPLHFTRAEMTVAAGAGFTSPPAHPPSAIPGSWRRVALPSVTRTGDLEVPRGGVVDAWFRARVSTPASDQPIYLYLPRWQTTGYIAVYADGQLIYAPRSGPRWNSFNLPVWAQVAGPGASAPHEILIHIQARPDAGFAVSSFWVGEKQALLARYSERMFLQVVAPQWGCAIFMVVGLLTLLLWIQRREEPAYLLIFATAAFQTIHSLQYFVGMDPVPIPENWFQWTESNAEVWYTALTFIMVTYYIGGPTVLMRRVTIVFIVMFSLSTGIFTALSLPIERANIIIWSLAIGASLAATVVAWIGFSAAPTTTGLLFCLFSSLIIPAAIADILTSRFVLSIEGVYVIPFVSLFQTILFLYIVSDRHLAALGVAEQSRAHLAVRLNAREVELAETYDRLRESERRQMLADERQRLMRDMHDGVGSSLMSALVVVQRGEVGAAETAQLLRDCLDDLKLAIDSLEPVDSDLLLLLATARYRLEPRFEQAGIKLLWTVGDLPAIPTITPEHALHVLRIVQEVFTNIVKHARASRVHLSVEPEGEAVRIRIVDDGVGFKPKLAMSTAGTNRQGRGLLNLTVRAAAIGAAIGWTSRKGRTCVEIKIPLELEPKDTNAPKRC